MIKNEAVLKELRDILKKAKDSDLKVAIFHTAHEFRNYMIRSKLSGQVLNRVTGALVDNINVKEEDSEPDRFRVIINPSMPYSAIHEFGGVIKPKRKGGMLRFSIGDNVFYSKSVTIPERSYLRSSRDEFDFQETALKKLRELVIA